MIIALLSLALWFLCGMQSFVIYVRRMANSTYEDYNGRKHCAVRLAGKQWEVRFERDWWSVGRLFILYTVSGLIGLGWQFVRLILTSCEGRAFNLGFRFVAKDIIPLEIARKLEDEEKKQQPQATQTTTSAQPFAQQLGLGIGATIGGTAMATQAQQIQQQVFGQPSSTP